MIKIIWVEVCFLTAWRGVPADFADFISFKFEDPLTKSRFLMYASADYADKPLKTDSYLRNLRKRIEVSTH